MDFAGPSQITIAPSPGNPRRRICTVFWPHSSRTAMGQTEGSTNEKHLGDLGDRVVADVVGCTRRGTSHRRCIGGAVRCSGIRTDRRCRRRRRGLHGGTVHLASLARREARTSCATACKARGAQLCQQWPIGTDQRRGADFSASRATDGRTQGTTTQAIRTQVADGDAAGARPRVMAYCRSQARDRQACSVRRSKEELQSSQRVGAACSSFLAISTWSQPRSFSSAALCRAASSLSRCRTTTPAPSRA
jgi:hypothetical protein